MIKRRAFISLLGGAAAWPLVARAQQPEQLRRIAVFMDLAEGDPEGQARVAALKRELQDLGWIEGRNLRIESRWAAGEAARMRPLAEELVSLAPEVIVSSGAPTLAALQQTTRTIPLVFAQVLDPVAASHAPVAISPDSVPSNTQWAGSGWVRSRRWCRTSSDSRYCATRGRV